MSESTYGAGEMTLAMALNLVAWTDSSVRYFGIETFRTPSLWWRHPGGSPIYLGAVICAEQVPDRDLRSGFRRVEDAWGKRGFHLYDCWANHDLSQIGFRRSWQNPWYLRLPSVPTVEFEMPLELSIETVVTADQLAEFELATWEGFEMVDEARRIGGQFSQHAAASLDDPDMYYLNARVHGQVVAGVIAHATDDMLGIYGLSTLPAFRRRGYATALVRACLTLRPELPVCVQPDPDTIPIYTAAGFLPGGQIAAWEKLQSETGEIL